jgi:hypothetical protein
MKSPITDASRMTAIQKLSPFLISALEIDRRWIANNPQVNPDAW